jgi:hypothetical protein
MRDTLSWFRLWFLRTAARLNIPDEVASAVIENPSVLGSACSTGLIEGLYYSKRAFGKATKIIENDGRDIAIGGYIGLSRLLLTEERRLTNLLREIVADPTRVMRFSEFNLRPVHATGEQNVACA